MIRHEVDKEAIIGHAVREMGKANDWQLAGIQDAVTTILDGDESFMGSDLITYLYDMGAWRAQGGDCTGGAITASGHDDLPVRITREDEFTPVRRSEPW